MIDHNLQVETTFIELAIIRLLHERHLIVGPRDSVQIREIIFEGLLKLQLKTLQEANRHALTDIGAQLGKIESKLTRLMKIRIEEATLEALVTMAESAVAADVHDKADAESLRSIVAGESDMSDGMKARITALVPASPAAGGTTGTTPTEGTTSTPPPAPVPPNAGDAVTMAAGTTPPPASNPPPAQTNP